MQNNEEYNDNWTMSNQIPISSGSSGSGYKFDYSFTSDEEKYSGSGLVLKSAGLSYEVERSTLEQDWPRYKSVAGQCLDSFTPPPSFSGAYSNAALGLALTLPAEWSVTETGIASAPLLFSSPFNQPEIRGALSIESVPAGTTAQQYLKSALQIITTALGSASGNGTDFTYSDGTIGYTQQMSGSQPTGAAYSFQMWDQIKNGRGITLMFAGMGEAVSSQTGPITQMVRSLVVSQPGGIAGVDRNNAIIMLEGEIPTLDPALVESGPGDIVGAIFSGLVRIDTDLKIAPDLAESWKVSPDGLTYTFILRPNAQFHNGQPVTAGDVKYSWERACDPLLKSPKAKSFLADIVGARDRLAGTASDIGGIKVIDDHTLEVTIDAARPYFLSELAQPVAFIVDKNDVISSQMLKTQPNGTGPFKVKTWQKDSLMVLERNDNFYLAPAKVKNLVFKLYAGDPMQLYESGEIDLAPVSISNQDRVLDQTNPLNKELVSGSSYDIYAIGFNVTKAPLDDIKIRQALVMALDASKLIDVTFKGRAERAAGFVPPGIPGNNPDLKPAVFDLAKAKQLIQESKYGSPDKVPEITIYVPYAVGPIDQAIIGMWQTLGLKVSSQVVNNLDDYRTRLNNKEFQVYEPSWRADYIDPQNFLEIFFQSQSPENGFAYNNPEVDAALAKAGKEQDPAVRLKMYQDIEKIVLADLPASPLWWKTKTYFLVKPYVKGYAVYPIDINIWRDLSVLPH
jgi:oligopeptide transport system substrate-binding protein